MLDLTRLNGETFKLNVLRIEQIQSLPDTTITLINGKKLVVKESEEELSAQILAIYRSIGLNGQQAETDGENR